MLNGVRVLELSRPQTMLAGQILADLGADVIAVEPPGGAPGRRMGPFLGDRIGLERSLTWHALNRNKRSVTIDTDSTDGCDAFERIAATADVVIEAAPARFAALADRGHVHCAVRAFSAHGPKSNYAFTDRTIVAAAGSLAYTGDGDRAPLFIPVPQAMMEAGAEAAIGVLAALAARDRDRQGQQVDVSMRTAAMMSAFSLPCYAATREPPPTRAGSRKRVLDVEIPAFHACRDGFVQVSVAFGGFGPVTSRMARWLVERDALAPELAEVDWSRFPASADPQEDRARLRALLDGLERAIAPMSKTDVGTAARTHGFFAAPLLDMADVASFAQYRERGLWARQALPDGVSIDAPAHFAQCTGHAFVQRRPAPALSEHTQEVLAEAGLSVPEIQALFCHHVL